MKYPVATPMPQRNTIYHGDCRKWLAVFPDCCIDMTLTSPPYDNLRSYDKDADWNFNVFETVAQELHRVTKDGGIVVWVSGDATVNGSESGTSFRQALYFQSIGFNIHDTMIYMKDNPPPVGGHTRYYQSFEYCFVFSKGAPKTFNPLTAPRRNKWNDKRTQRVRPVVRNKDGVFNKKTVLVNQGEVKLSNVWSYTVSGGRVAEEKVAHEHPAIFPEQLASDHIVSWSDEGDLILDPFSGSGTTLKMAKANSRDFVGIEISEAYNKIAEQRLREKEEADDQD